MSPKNCPRSRPLFYFAPRQILLLLCLQALLCHIALASLVDSQLLEPTFVLGEWSECNVTCGQGVRTRQVECKLFLTFSKRVETIPDDQCGSEKPATVQTCSPGPCTSSAFTSAATASFSSFASSPSSPSTSTSSSSSPSSPSSPFFPFTKRHGNFASRELTQTNSPSLTSKPAASSGKTIYLQETLEKNRLQDEDEDDDDDEDDVDERERKELRQLQLQQKRQQQQQQQKQQQLQQQQEASNSEGGKNIQLQFEWRTNGFTPCTASCLGGTQESIIECIRSLDQQVVTPYLCDIASKPESVTKTCNDFPCPPRWEVSEWSNCSTNCGSGHQHRTVRCIHEVTRGHENTITVPDSKCSLPAPKSKRFCNISNCTTKWITEPWSNCNRKCGTTGTIIRSVICVREKDGQNVPVDHNLCNSPKPATKKSCNHGPCYGSYEPPKNSGQGTTVIHKSGKNSKLIVSSNDALYIQQEPIKRVTVKVGGKAVLFEGTTVKIRCPRKKSPHKVEWSKDRRKLNYTSHMQLTPKYALRIKNLKSSDAGIYTCTVGPSQASIIISLKSSDSILHKKLSYSHDLLQPFNTSKSPTNKVLLPLSSSSSDSHTTEVSNEVSIRSFDFSTLETRYVSDERQEIDSEQGYSADSSSPVLQWIISEWSKCSASCNSMGIQVRGIQCILSENRFMKTVVKAHCLDAGLQVPEHIRECKVTCIEKNTWHIDDWTDCTGCLRSGVGLQSRSVSCRAFNGTILPDVKCIDSGPKPQMEKECINDLCIAEWRAGPWSECTGQCDTNGVDIAHGKQSRSVECHWLGTSKSAGNECPIRDKPSDSQRCRATSCNLINSCSDRSPYCHAVKEYNLCRFDHWKHECCSTCKSVKVLQQLHQQQQSDSNDEHSEY